MSILPDPRWGRLPVHKPHIAELVAHERPRTRDDRRGEHSGLFFAAHGCRHSRYDADKPYDSGCFKCPLQDPEDCDWQAAWRK